MHGRPFDRARFVNDPLEQPPDCCLGARPAVRALHAFEHFAFALRLIERLMFRLLYVPDFDGAARPLVQQLDELLVDLIDAAAPLIDGHGATSRRLIPCRAASFSARTRSPRAAAAASGDFARSISFTSAEPTTAASASPPRIETCPGSDMPKPTAMGDRKSTRLNSSHSQISYAVFCLKKKKNKQRDTHSRTQRANTKT